MNHYIVLDDERTLDKIFSKKDIQQIEHGNIYLTKTAEETIEVLEKIVLFGRKSDELDMIYISLDHDLGQKKTGYDVAKWIIENESPVWLKYRCHSMNPIGKFNIEQLLDHYGFERF